MNLALPSRRSRRVRLACISVVLAALAVPLTASTGNAANPPVADTQPWVSGTLLVGLRPGVAPAAERAALARVHGRAIATFGGGGVLVAVRTGTERRAATVLRRLPTIRYAELNGVEMASNLPDDPSFPLQWGLRNTGQVVNGFTGTAGADVDAQDLWSMEQGSGSVVVAEVDSGIDYTHPDLAANVWTNPGGVGGCPAGTHGYNVVAQTCDPMDDYGHGTHVAGIMGAVGNNGTGITGLMWSTSLLPVKWLNSRGRGSDFRLIQALDWVVTAKQAGVNIAVVNDSGVFVKSGYSQAVSDAIGRLAANNILLVVAAGNNKTDLDITPHYPCSYQASNEICVAATDSRDRLAGFSNWGPNTVQLAAPGKNIYSTLPGGSYGYMSGTSMAAPLVSATAAMVASAEPQDTLSQIRSDVLSGVDVLSRLSGVVGTSGRLDACRAVAGCVPSR